MLNPLRYNLSMDNLPIRKIVPTLFLLTSIVLTTLYFAQKKNFETRTRAQEPVSSTTKNYTVAYQNSRFTPEKITVKFGGSVTWINKSPNKLWVASGPHPSHALYPEFDSKKVIEPNESYTFTFTKKGYWGYHNHTNDDAEGVVITE